MDKKISKFDYHVDNINETVKAKSINDLGNSINQIERNIVEVADEDFSSSVFFALENSLKANAVFMDDLKNSYRIFQSKSIDIEYDTKESCVKINRDGNITEGTIQSVVNTPQYPSSINEVSLMVDDYIPKGAAIFYSVSVDGIDFFPIKTNISTLTKLAKTGGVIFFKAKLVKNKNFESPKIYGWAILYRDPILERLYGIRNYDLARFDSEVVGETVLIRDRLNEDRIVLVIDPESMTEMKYDPLNDNRLDRVLERVDDRIIQEKMNYGPYYNSYGQDEVILLGTTKSLITEAPTVGSVPVEYSDKLDQIVKEESDI